MPWRRQTAGGTGGGDLAVVTLNRDLEVVLRRTLVPMGATGTVRAVDETEISLSSCMGPIQTWRIAAMSSVCCGRVLRSGAADYREAA